MQRAGLGAVIAIFGAGCGHLPSAGFVDATGRFADAAEQVTQSFGSEIDTAAALCRKRARLDFSQHRIEATAGGDFDWAKGDLWRDWAARHKVSAESSDTWQVHCDRIASADRLQERALTVIAAYGSSLRTLATGAGYDGSDVSAIAQQASGLASSLAGDKGAAKTIRDVVAGVAGPLDKIVSFLVQARTQGELRQLIRDADPSVQKLLGGLLAYTAATDEEARDLDQREKDFLLSWEVKESETAGALSEAHVHKKALGSDPDRVAHFHAFASDLDEEHLRLSRHQEAHRAALDDLAQAHARLTEAAASTSAADIKGALRKVLGLVTQLLGEIAQMR